MIPDQGEAVQPAVATSPERIVFEEGVREIRAWLGVWHRRPLGSVAPWMGGSLLIALALMGCSLLVAGLSRPDGELYPIGVQDSGQFRDVLSVCGHNYLVLALHTLVCWASFLARRSVPANLHLRSGVDRFVHQHAGPIALAAVAGATMFSLSTQAFFLGHLLADEAAAVRLAPAALLAILSVHGLLELTAVFLPLAACLALGRRRRWDRLGAATIFTAAWGAPLVLVAALIEVYATPHLLLLVTSG